MRRSNIWALRTSLRTSPSPRNAGLIYHSAAQTEQGSVRDLHHQELRAVPERRRADRAQHRKRGVEEETGVFYQWHEFNAQHAFLRDEGPRYDPALAWQALSTAARGMLVVSVARRLGSEGPLLAYCAALL